MKAPKVKLSQVFQTLEEMYDSVNAVVLNWVVSQVEHLKWWLVFDVCAVEHVWYVVVLEVEMFKLLETIQSFNFLDVVIWEIQRDQIRKLGEVEHFSDEVLVQIDIYKIGHQIKARNFLVDMDVILL